MPVAETHDDVPRAVSKECGADWSGLFVAPGMKTLFSMFMPSISVRARLTTRSPA